MAMSKWVPTTDLMTLRRLGKSCEELGELVAVLGRSICQGLDGVDPASGENNLDRITKESADVMAQIECNMRAFRLSREAMSRRTDHKIALMAEWEAMFLSPPDDDSEAAGGWIEWHGDECPVAPETLVHLRFRGESRAYGWSANPAGAFRWYRNGDQGDIVAYRVSGETERGEE